MKLKLAVPANPVYEKLYRNLNTSADTELLKVSENESYRLLLNNNVDCALISPFGYSKGVRNHDLRIVPATALTAIGYTGIGSIFFKSGIEEITTIGSDTPDDFLMLLSSILVSEKYGVEKKIEKSNKTKDEIINEFDMSFLWATSSLNQQALDVSEEWHDSYEMPLPIVFWASRNEEHADNLIDILNSIADIHENEEIIFESIGDNNKYHHREGKLIWTWNDDAESALEQVLQLLYFHQFTEEIAAVKLLGRD